MDQAAQKIAIRDLQFTDMLLHESGRVMFKNLGTNPGLSRPPKACIEELTAIWSQVFSRELAEWTLRHNGVPYRVSRIASEGGKWAILRRGDSGRPNLQDLGYPLPLCQRMEQLGRRPAAGLILIAGPMGGGKTTLASALLAHYVATYGGLGLTLENPPELNLDGPCGPAGWIMQCDLRDESYKEVYRAMRSSADYMLLGEVRTPEGAKQAVRQAINGILVITTVHANNVSEAINAVATLCSADGAEDVAWQNLGSGLSMVLHQRLSGAPRRPQTEFLFFDDKESPSARAYVRERRTEMLGTDIARQAAKMLKGNLGSGFQQD